jgi:hypothetical protein
VSGWVATLAPGNGRRWSLAGAVAAVAALFAFSAEPPLLLLADGGSDEESVQIASSPTAPEAAVEVSASGSAATLARERTAASAAAMRSVEPEALASSFESTGEEVFADMPEAVQAFLRNSRELRLTNQDDRYLRSNYSYPLRRFPDVTPVFLTGEESPGSAAGVRPVADQGTTVITF